MKVKTARTLANSVVTMCLLFAASMAHAGYYYESVTEGRTSGQRKGNYQKVQAWVEGDNARVEFASGEKKGWFADGNFLVTTDGGENVYLVNPGEETYAPFNLDEMMATMGEVMNMMEQTGGMVKMEFTDATSEKLLEEPGESLLGHSTTHHRYKSGYTSSISVMGMKRESRNETVMDIWSTDALEARGFGVWLKPDRQMKTGNQGLDEMLDQKFGQIEGFPLKMVMEMTTFNKKGKPQQTMTSTTEVTVLREESVADSQFTWPEHYTETEILPDVEGMQAGQQAGEDDKKKKKKGGLSSVFGGKPDDDG